MPEIPTCPFCIISILLPTLIRASKGVGGSWRDCPRQHSDDDTTRRDTAAAAAVVVASSPFRPICVVMARQSRDFVTLITKFCASNERRVETFNEVCPVNFRTSEAVGRLDAPRNPPTTHTPSLVRVQVFRSRSRARARELMRERRNIQKSILCTLE